MRSSYHKEDVTFLLKDITGLVEPLPTTEREKLIQSGRHYSEMLPVEYVPTEAYMRVYHESLETFAAPVARALGSLADTLVRTRGRDVVLVSLARAGTPVGILLKRYLKKKYQMDVPHYSVSIIRGRGIDGNAMRHLLGKYRPEQLLFVDGWTGKGAIRRELSQALAAYEGVSSELAVIADPANVTRLCGTHEDLLIPSACLNSTVCGLVSRTFLRRDIIGDTDFHGAVYYEELKDADLSYEFIDAIERNFGMEQTCKAAEIAGQGLDEAREIGRAFGVDDINRIKPGIGEATRVLLRRVPWKILIDARCRDDAQLRHLVRLAKEKHVPLEEYPLRHYKCCGIIKKVADA